MCLTAHQPQAGTITAMRQPGNAETPTEPLHRRLRASVSTIDSRIERRGASLRERRPSKPAAWAASRGGDLVPIMTIGYLLRRNPRRGLGVALIIAAQALTVNYGLKTLVRRQRPSGPSHHTSSFPSGHTATAVTLAVIAGAPAPLLVSASLTSAARILKGVHWASDVVAGAAVGTVIGLTTRRLLTSS
jgi:membrane-associated phospholipid phosphatase